MLPRRAVVALTLALAACTSSPGASPPFSATATATDAHASLPTPFLFVDEPVIVRSGPGVAFPVSTEIPAQRLYAVVGKNVSWWLIELENGNTGWVYGEIYTTNFVGDPLRVPVVAGPPVPTPRPTPTCVTESPSTTPTGGGIVGARASLARFFASLDSRDYESAAQLYAGPYDVLGDINPLVGPDDHAGLLRNACEINGYQCLQILRVLSEREVSLGEYQFTVEFANPDGSTFVRGQCCGASETDMPSQSEFTYTVREICPGSYYVMDLPVYVP